MSAPAPALAKVQRRAVTVRLADSAVAVAYVSLGFGLLLILFPEAFPRIILNNWQSGNLILAVMIFALLLDVWLYFRVAYLQSARPTIPAAVCIGALPIVVVVGLTFVLQGAVAQTLSGDLPNLQARVGEEILAHTYLGLVSAVFLPFVAIRFLQQLTDRSSSRRTESPVR